MDGENLTGSPSEFLAMVGHTTTDESQSNIPDPETDVEPLATDLSAAADAESAEEDDDLSPEERVAAVLGEDVDEEEDGEPEAALDADTDDEDDEDTDPADLDALTPAQMRELAEEALKARAEAPQQELARIQATAHQAAEQAAAGKAQEIEDAFQREVIGLSRAHYGKLIDDAIELNDRAQVARIVNAQREWEAQQRLSWQPQAETLVSDAYTRALKADPGIRQLYATWLSEERQLPKNAIDDILTESDTDRMAERADWLVKLRDVKRAERRRGNQQVREEAAKRVSATRIAAPATGRPAPAKVVPLRGTAEEWLAARKRGVV